MASLCVFAGGLCDYIALNTTSISIVCPEGLPMRLLELKTFLDCKSNPSIQAGVAEWLSRQPRDLTKEG
jgi:hypothetical protein